MHTLIEGIKQFSIIYTLKWSENIKKTEMTQVVPFCISGHEWKAYQADFAQEMVVSCLFIEGMLHLPQSQKALDLFNRKKVWLLAVLTHYA